MKAPGLHVGNLSRRLVRFAAICLSAVVFTPLFPVSAAAGDVASFSVFAENSIWVREGATIHSGDIGTIDASPGPWLDSQSEVTIGQGTTAADGVSIYGDTVKIKQNGSVDAVSYNEIDNNGTIRGEEYTPLALPLEITLPVFPTPNPGTDNYEIPIGETLTLSPGSYGGIKVKQNATLILEGGTYHLEELTLARVYRLLDVTT